MRKIFNIILILVILVLLILGAFFGLKKFFPQLFQKSPAPPSSQTFSLPPLLEVEDFAISIQESGPTIGVSWNDSQIDVFQLTLIDVEKYQKQAESSFENPPENPLIWLITSLTLEKPPIEPPQRKNVTLFLTPLYLVGEKKAEFQWSGAELINLEEGKEYWLQVNGFDKNGRLSLTGKKFTFKGGE